MSKASEYATIAQAIEETIPPSPEFSKMGTTGDLPIAWVTKGGTLHLESENLTPGDAIALGRWLIDTFGDKP